MDMEDTISVKSNESLATSDEFDIVGEKPSANKTPTLDLIDGDLSELKTVLTEVLNETENNIPEIEHTGGTTWKSILHESTSELSDPLNKLDEIPSVKPDTSSEDSCCISDIDQECTIFSGVTYLGAATVNAPKSEGEIQRNIAILHEQCTEQGIKISISVPSSSQGMVVLYDANTQSVISRYEIHRILFYARGSADSLEAGCFAFTWSHGDSQESAIFQCHVFRCDIAEAVSRVSACFAKAFQRVPRSMSNSVTTTSDVMSASVTTISESRTLMYVFEVNLEIKEDDGKGSYSTVGRDKNGFRLKTNMEKQLCLTIKEVSENGPHLFIERCFGVLLAAGRHVKHSDMQLLEMKEQAGITSCERNNTSISAAWDPSESSFELLNQETPKDTKQYMTVAVDLVIRGIQEPVRFLIETTVRVFGQNERNFWYFQRRSLIQQFYLNLKEIVSPLNDVNFEVLSMETSGELDKSLLNLNLNLANLIQSPSITSIDILTPKEECHSDGDEPLLSGTGLVSKDCSEDVLENWADVLSRWKSTKQKPKQLTHLVRLGIPEALRGEVWQRLAGIDENKQMMENYRLLITKECSCESVIQRDIARTFPAHDFFKEAGGLGQDSLYRVSKAYAIYDSEVGYCQGLSFLAATLLLHMPEEQAFCVLVKLMYDYRLRDLYKNGFDNLYLRLYQLHRLIEEQLPQLAQHFTEHHIETHMFASQWFLTLFTARFPLYFVFHIIDIFLLHGIETLFQVALALLMFCKKDLIHLDFEGILKYFRVSLPKKCRTEESAKYLIKLACNIKVKRLKKYESDFTALNEAVDKAEREATEVEQLRMTLMRYEEERKLMVDEISQLKEMLKREVCQAEMEKNDSTAVINEYMLTKQKLEAQLRSVRYEFEDLKMKVSSCDKCSSCIDRDVQGRLTENIDDKERIRELELELAQTKLAQVESECKNQNLTHQLRAMEVELGTAKNSWAPWLSKTLNSIKEVANKKDFTAIVSQPNFPNTPTFISHINAPKRESVQLKAATVSPIEEGRHTGPLLKDSQSYSNLAVQK